jgi:hypothetical protein
MRPYQGVQEKHFFEELGNREVDDVLITMWDDVLNTQEIKQTRNQL